MTRIVLAFILALAFQLVSADVLLIEEVRQSGRMQLPTNGQSTADVEASFGAPSAKSTAVGDPPISNWKYEKYSVYFERDLVLFTVLHPGVVIEK
jgi:hypothetical protein